MTSENLPPYKEFYAIRTFTGNSRRVPIAPKLKVQLIGDKGITSWLPIKNPANFSSLHLLQKNRGDIIYVLGESVGHLSQIRVKLGGLMRNWMMQKIEIINRGRVFVTSANNIEISKKATLNLLYTGDRWSTFLNGRLALGPILKFRGIEKRVTDVENLSSIQTSSTSYYKVSVAITTENVNEDADAHALSLSYSSNLHSIIRLSNPIILHQFGDFKCWRYDFEFELQDESQICEYTLPNGFESTFTVPGINEKPHVIFGSCLDREHPYRLTFMSNRTASWLYLKEDHNTNPYHMMILGGDQVYADQIFVCTKEFINWDLKKNNKKKFQQEFTESMRRDGKSFYFFLYLFSWNEGAIMEVMSRIPTIMMWDDHDTFDGWGSLQPEYLHSNVIQGLFPISKEAFLVHQLSGDFYPVINQENRNGPFTTAFQQTGDTLFLLLDTRSERDMIDHKHGIIHSENSWSDIERWFSSDECRKNDHLFVIATTPLVYPHRPETDWIMDKTNSESIDDSRDHWPAPIHKEELNRLVLNMNDFLRCSPNNSKSVTVLSGDVHVGALGSIRDAETDNILMDQLISSGMGSVPPPRIALWAFKYILHTHFQLKDNIKTQMEKLPHGEYFLETQNYLDLTPIYGRSKPTYSAKWIGVPKNKHDNFEIAYPLPFPIEMIVETH